MTMKSKLNKHLQTQLDSSYCSLLPDDVKQDLESEYITMSSIGIDNNEDQNKFFMILNHVPQIAKSIFHLVLNNKTALAVSAEVFKNKEKMPVDTLLGLIEAIDLALKKMMPFDVRPKVAYPQPNSRMELPRYDLSRWVSATHKIYSLVAKGHSEQEARQIVLESWDKREKMDYDQWVKFYKERTPDKYPKLAFDSELMLAGVPANSLRAVLPAPSGFGYNKPTPGFPQNLPHSTNDVSDIRDKIESQRRKIISRLNSAEKMLASMDGQLFAGEDQELMLKLLQDLKRRIQTANKLTVKSSLFEDHIFRTANQLRFQGKQKAAGFFFKIAQLPPLGAPLGGAGGTAGLFGAPPPDGDSAEPALPGNKQDTEALLREFFDNLTRGVNDKNDTPEERAHPESEEPTPAPAPMPPAAPAPALPPEPMSTEPAVSEDGKTASDFDDYIKLGSGIWQPIKTAQLPPPRKPPQPRLQPAAPAGPLDVEIDGPDKVVLPDDNTDDVIDAALNNITIQDVIRRLEMLVSIYNQREISRQLAFLDIMMDRLGLASFFPQLGEAMGKSLEANQYIGNRLEEILGKLKGSVDAPKATEWVETPRQENPATAGLRSRLQQEEDKEEQRKEMRKQKEVAKMQQGQAGPGVAPAADGKVPEIEIREPVSRIEKQPPIETR